MCLRQCIVTFNHDVMGLMVSINEGLLFLSRRLGIAGNYVQIVVFNITRFRGLALKISADERNDGDSEPKSTRRSSFSASIGYVHGLSAYLILEFSKFEARIYCCNVESW